MRTCRVLVALLGLFSFVADVASATHPNESSPFVVFETSDAPGKLDSNKLEECLRLTLRELNLDGRPLPRIAVYHISTQAGHYLGMDTNSNWRSNGGGHPRYEMWIVGPPSNSLLTRMIENILERHFELQIDEAARARMVNHVERGLNATVDVRSFR